MESVSFEIVFNGIVKVLDREAYANFTDWQKLLARVAMSRVIGSRDDIKNMLMNNNFIKTLAIMDENGMVDAEHILNEIKTHLTEMEKMEIEIPLFGKFKFVPGDVDKLRGIIYGEN